MPAKTQPENAPYANPWAGSPQSGSARDAIQFVAPAGQAQAEARVHLVRFRKPAVGRLVVLAAIGVALTALAGIGFFLVLTSKDAAVLWLLPLVVFGVVGIVLAAVGARSLLQVTRSSPGSTDGVVLSESGLALRMPGLDTELPWASIDSIDAGVISVEGGRRGDQEVPTIDIRARGELHCLTVASLSTPPLVAYSALKFYLDNPALRTELGTESAQSRFDRWHAAEITR